MIGILFLFLSGRVGWWVMVGIPVSFMLALAIQCALELVDLAPTMLEAPATLRSKKRPKPMVQTTMGIPTTTNEGRSADPNAKSNPSATATVRIGGVPGGGVQSGAVRSGRSVGSPPHQ